MEVFISWSGDRSKAIATALHGWIPRVIQRMKPWLSLADIEKGARWHSEIAVHLNESRVGISCLTPENLEAPWLLFEAGAMSKQLEKPYVCTYLFDLKPTGVKDPFAQFQATRAEKEDTLKLMQTINRAPGENALPEDHLVTAFDKWWPDFETALKKIPDFDGKPAPTRPTEEILEEILALVREQTRSVAYLSAAVSLPKTGFGSLFGSPPSDVGGGTTGMRFRDLVQTLVGDQTPDGQLARNLSEALIADRKRAVAAALDQVAKEREKIEKPQKKVGDA